MRQYFLFISTIIYLSIFFITYVTIKNDCRNLINENYLLEDKKKSYGSQITYNKSKVKTLMGRKRIEKIGMSEFNLVVAEPESVIVVIN